MPKWDSAFWDPIVLNAMLSKKHELPHVFNSSRQSRCDDCSGNSRTIVFVTHMSAKPLSVSDPAGGGPFAPTAHLVRVITDDHDANARTILQFLVDGPHFDLGPALLCHPSKSSVTRLNCCTLSPVDVIKLRSSSLSNDCIALSSSTMVPENIIAEMRSRSLGNWRSIAYHIKLEDSVPLQ